MSCSSAEALFERFLDGAAAERERNDLIAHVEGCVDCRALLEELRALDALLGEPRGIDLAPNFTFVTMAEARTLPPPSRYRTPLRAYLIAYLAAAWLVTGAAAVVAQGPFDAFAATLLGLTISVGAAAGGLATTVSHAVGHGSVSLTAMLGALCGLDVLLVLTFGFALRFVRPELAPRLHS